MFCDNLSHLKVPVTESMKHKPSLVSAAGEAAAAAAVGGRGDAESGVNSSDNEDEDGDLEKGAGIVGGGIIEYYKRTAGAKGLANE